MMKLCQTMAMPIISARRYAKGKVEHDPVVIADTLRPALAKGSFEWIGLADPAADELTRIGAYLGLHSLAVEDALSPEQQPKVEIYGNQLFIVSRTAAFEEGERIAYGQTALFVGCDFIVSVRHGSTRDHSALRQRLESDVERMAEGPDYVAHAILDFVVDGYQPIMEQLEEAVQAMEERAINVFPDQSTIRRIFRLRRQLRRFQRIAGPMEEVCERLSTTDLPTIDAGARIWFRDVLDHVRRVMARVDGLKETLASIVETASLLETQRQGQITRQLAAWAAILAVPTAIAGIYGMNFENMPELSHRWGYPAVLAAIGLICGGLFWRFRRIGWL